MSPMSSTTFSFLVNCLVPRCCWIVCFIMFAGNATRRHELTLILIQLRVLVLAVLEVNYRANRRLLITRRWFCNWVELSLLLLAADALNSNSARQEPRNEGGEEVELLLLALPLFPMPLVAVLTSAAACDGDVSFIAPAAASSSSSSCSASFFFCFVFFYGYSPKFCLAWANAEIRLIQNISRKT